jgi:TolB protein
MKLRYVLLIAMLAAISVPFLIAQNPVIGGTIVAGDRARIAVPDFRGKGAALPLMNTFNETVWNDLADAGILDMVAKTNYPLDVPQSPADLRPPTVVNGQTVKNGMWLTDWSSAPVSTNYLGIGYVDVNGADLVLRGSLLNAGLADLRTASVFANNPYFGPATEEGARKIAHEYAADILKQMGAKSLAGTKIYFVSDRSGQKEIWSMDYDGQNAQRMTSHRTISKMPAISADGKLAAYVTMVTGEGAGWQIRLFDTETRRPRTFVNPVTSTLATPEFSPDGAKLWFAMVTSDWQQLAVANVDGSNRQRISQVKAIEVSPRVNPKNANEVLFISGRTGHPQLFKMNADGSGVEMITTNEGDVANPSWSPDGRKIAFSWTRGYDPGNFNVFVMDTSTKQPVQLTRQNGSNENPSWAPDGVHLVYSNQRGSNTQIYTMLANGTRVKQLTSAGNNAQPVWASKGTN